jgi:predicted phosphoadenosine phosphosulfate sulfurtransferase
MNCEGNRRDLCHPSIWLVSSQHMIGVITAYDWCHPSICLVSSQHTIGVIPTYDWCHPSIRLVSSQHMIVVIPAYDWCHPSIWFVSSQHMIGVIPAYDWCHPSIWLLSSQHMIGVIPAYDWCHPSIWLVSSQHMIGVVPAYDWEIERIFKKCSKNGGLVNNRRSVRGHSATELWLVVTLLLILRRGNSSTRVILKCACCVCVRTMPCELSGRVRWNSLRMSLYFLHPQPYFLYDDLRKLRDEHKAKSTSYENGTWHKFCNDGFSKHGLFTLSC